MIYLYLYMYILVGHYLYYYLYVELHIRPKTGSQTNPKHARTSQNARPSQEQAQLNQKEPKQTKTTRKMQKEARTFWNKLGLT